MDEPELINRFIRGLVLISKNGTDNFDLGWFYTKFYVSLKTFFSELVVDLNKLKQEK